MKTFTYTTRCKTILGDLHTPVSTYLKVRDIFPQSALMESSDYHGGENGRSFIGLDPIAKISVHHGYATAYQNPARRHQGRLRPSSHVPHRRTYGSRTAGSL